MIKYPDDPKMKFLVDRLIDPIERISDELACGETYERINAGADLEAKCADYLVACGYLVREPEVVREPSDHSSET